MRVSATTIAVVLALLGGCDDAGDDAFRRRNTPDNSDDPSVPRCTGPDVGESYAGFGGEKLEDKRVNARIGADRLRLKPYSALRGEYERTIGAAPASLEGAAGSFGVEAPRFHDEPRANAIQVYSAFRVAFDGCLGYVGDKPAFASAPTAESASAQCSTLARAFWSRSPSADEVKQCSDVAMVDAAAEADPKRRWAYVCATLLSSAGFLTY